MNKKEEEKKEEKKENLQNPKLVSVNEKLDPIKLINIQQKKIQKFDFAKAPNSKNNLGRELKCYSNFFLFKFNSKIFLFTKYSIQIKPEIPDDSKIFRKHLINLANTQIKEKLGNF